MSLADERWVIYGSGLSALVLAERLGSAGRSVVLLSPVKSWGGIFNGVRAGELIFDAGMTNFEFDLFGTPADDIQFYLPDRKSDVGRYVHFVREYLATFVKVHPIAKPKMADGNRFVDDLLICNEFEALKDLPAEVRNQMRSELVDILARPNPLHPRSKNDPDSPLRTSSLEQASRANHGSVFHDLYIEPFFRKVLGLPTAQIEAVFHRNGWVPLFYPETLLSQFGVEPQRLQPTAFHYPDDSHFGAFIGRIVAKVRALSNVVMIDSIHDIEIDSTLRIARTAAGDFPFDQLAWGGDLSLLAPELSGKICVEERPRVSLDLFFLSVLSHGVKRDFSVLTDPREVSPFYRVTNQTSCSGRHGPIAQIILECNSQNWVANESKSRRVFDEALDFYGINPSSVVLSEHRTFAGALGIPSNQQMKNFSQLQAHILDRFPGIHLVGHSSGTTSVTLNDQIIQALKIAHKEGALL
jgi:hypothetical protein